MNHPPLAVLLPFYNAAETLTQTLDSILAQSFGDFSLIAVDDGSSDSSAEIVRRYMQHDRRIALHQPGRQGVVGAMNHALAHCPAALCARMDADDIMEPDRLQRQFDYLQANPNITLLGSRVSLFPLEQIQEGFHEYIRWQNDCITPQQIADNIYVELPIAHPSVMFRRDAIIQAGGYRDGDFPEDYELLLRLHQGGHQMAKLPEVLLHWRDSGGRLTRTDARYSRDSLPRCLGRYRSEKDRQYRWWGQGGRPRVVKADRKALCP